MWIQKVVSAMGKEILKINQWEQYIKRLRGHREMTGWRN